LVPLGSEYVVSLRDVVRPLTELEEDDVLKDWNVEFEEDMVRGLVIWKRVEIAHRYDIGCGLFVAV
jgi:hypothetical protein